MGRINNRSKMKYTNKKALAWLRARGFTVDVIPHTRWHLDLFGVADAVAIKDSDLWLVQFQTNQWHELERYEQFFLKHKVNIMVIMFKDREKEPHTRIWSRFPSDFFTAKPV